MKLVTILITFCVIYFSYFAARRGRAHAVFEDKKQYEKMTFDLLLRGSWMLNHCARQLFNCYEIVKADMVCSNGKYYSSVCAVQRDWCHSQYGPVDYPHPNHYQLYEGECSAADYEYWTRRARGATLRLH